MRRADFTLKFIIVPAACCIACVCDGPNGGTFIAVLAIYLEIAMKGISK